MTLVRLNCLNTGQIQYVTSTHKCAKTHASAVFVTRDLDL